MDRHEEHVGDQLLAALEANGDAVVGGRGRLEADPGAEGDATLLEGTFEGGADGWFLSGHEPGEGLDDRHLGTERAHDGGELDADDTPAEDDHPARDRLEGQGTVARHDRAAEVEPGKGACVRPGREHDVPPDEAPVADDDGAPFEATLALHVLHLA